MKTTTASTLSAALLAVVATTASPADLLVHNVSGYTLTQSGKLRQFEALLVRDGKVVATGLQKELSKKAPDATRLDGQGKFLLPGLTDAHGHIMNLGYSRTQIDLVGTRSLAEAQQRVRAFADANPQAQWLRGRGWNQVIWGLNRFPTAAELDKVVWDRPVWLKRVDGHAGWANKQTLELAGITRDTKAPEGGRIERDAQGNPTGVLGPGRQHRPQAHARGIRGRARRRAARARQRRPDLGARCRHRGRHLRHVQGLRGRGQADPAHQRHDRRRRRGLRCDRQAEPAAG
jgi:hypothetical protein